MTEDLEDVKPTLGGGGTEAAIARPKGFGSYGAVQQWSGTPWVWLPPIERSTS